MATRACRTLRHLCCIVAVVALLAACSDRAAMLGEDCAPRGWGRVLAWWDAQRFWQEQQQAVDERVRRAAVAYWLTLVELEEGAELDPLDAHREKIKAVYDRRRQELGSILGAALAQPGGIALAAAAPDPGDARLRRYTAQVQPARDRLLGTMAWAMRCREAVTAQLPAGAAQ